MMMVNKGNRMFEELVEIRRAFGQYVVIARQLYELGADDSACNQPTLFDRCAAVAMSV